MYRYIRNIYIQYTFFFLIEQFSVCFRQVYYDAAQEFAKLHGLIHAEATLLKYSPSFPALKITI